MRISRQGVEFGGGFAFVAFVAVVLLFCYQMVKLRPDLLDKNPLKEVLSATRDERALRNMQDPLAMRLYALSEVSLPSVEAKSKIIEAIIEQWGKEVSQLGTNAWRTSAASLSLDGLGLGDADRQKVMDAMKKVPAAPPSDSKAW